jgi:hypothetical protein
MSVKKFIWVVRLYLNLLTGGINDYVASVLSKGKKTMRTADIARIIVERRTELKFSTILSVLNDSDAIIRELVQQGNSVLTGCCQVQPERVTGTWAGPTANFDPKVHKIGLHIIPSAEMRKALKEVFVEVLGKKDDGAFIGLVTNQSTGLVDNVMNTGDDIIIEGDKLKIAYGKDDKEEDFGVFFVGADSTATRVTRRLVQNDPKKLVTRMPDLPAGQYTLRVVTRFASGNNILKEPRVIEYGRPLVIN